MKVRITETLVIFGGRIEGEYYVAETVETNDGERLRLERDGRRLDCLVPWECVEIVE